MVLEIFHFLVPIDQFHCIIVKCKDVNQKPEIPFLALKPKIGSITLAADFHICLSLSFLSRKLHKNYQMPDKINLHMLSVYKSFHQTVKYDQQKYHILEGITGLEI